MIYEEDLTQEQNEFIDALEEWIEGAAQVALSYVDTKFHNIL